jgi:hypothetical protein
VELRFTNMDIGMGTIEGRWVELNQHRLSVSLAPLEQQKLSKQRWAYRNPICDDTVYPNVTDYSAHRSICARVGPIYSSINNTVLLNFVSMVNGKLIRKYHEYEYLADITATITTNGMNLC